MLHLIVLIWGFTGIIGKEITASAFVLVPWRTAIAALALGAYMLWKKISLKVSPQSIVRYSAIGCVIGFHWFSFFHGIKLSNVSAALVMVSTTALFVSLTGPLIRKTKFALAELGLAVLVCIGLFLVFHGASFYITGMIWSLVSAFAAAIFSNFNALYAHRDHPVVISFWEMVVASCASWVVAIFQCNAHELLPSFSDMIWLVVLGVVATAFPFLQSIKIMRNLSPFTVAIALNLEPIYTILIASFIYGQSEWMSAMFYVGAAVILLVVATDAWFRSRISGA
jgi:drug/metabolite transporter (DMT)-like permease